MTKQRIGGSFAPPLPAEKLVEYRQTIETHAADDIKQALLGLCDMVQTFQQTPESSAPKAKHPVGVGFVQPLDESEIKRIWDLVPWDWECAALETQFNKLAVDSPLRTPAFHLLWFAKELTKDRQPCTNDKL